MSEPTVHTLCDEAQKLFDEIFKEMENEEVLVPWLESHGVSCELFVFTGDEPWQEVFDAGASVQESAMKTKRKVFRTEGDSDTMVYFIAKSDKQIIKLLQRFKSKAE